MALIHLIYVSTAFSELGAGDLERILESAVRRNTALNVTGMLLYADGSFMQVLEGEAAAVDEVFARVENDTRHTGIFLIERAPIDERSFDKWSMGFKRLDAREAAAHPAYAPFFERGFDAARIGARPGLAFEMLINFSRGQRAIPPGGFPIA
jgi:hypothetical protein